jgi:regulator of RNase E activity RraA
MSLDTARGVYVIAPTPFHDDGRVDDASIDRMTDFLRAAGATGITVLGQMGEAPKLDAAEALAIAARVIRRAGMPVVVGVTAPGFAAMRALAREAMDAGAAGVMIAPPNTLRTDEQIVGYYRQAVEAIGADVPFVIQDYPLTFSVVMTPAVIRRIVQENASCLMLKHEDWPGLEKISALRGFERDGSMRRISILTGNGGLFLDFEMERRRRRDDRLLLPGHARRRGAAVGRRQPRRRPRPVRCAPAADPLRTAAGHRAGGAQVRADEARRDRLGSAAQAGGEARAGGARRGRLPAVATGPHRFPCADFMTGPIQPHHRDNAMPAESLPLEPKIIEQLAGVSTATLTTVLLKKGLRNVWLRGTRPLRPDQPRIVGRAFTLRFVPAREDLATPESWSSPLSTRAAIEAMPAGCVAVVDAMGCTSAGIFGDILCSRMRRRGVAALVTDGVVRDVAGVLATGLPVWCQGVAAPPSVAGLTFVNWQEPIGCGGVAVFPNDVIVVDADGAVLIPAALLDQVIAAAVEQERLEGWIMREVEGGAALPGLYPPDAENRARYEAAMKVSGR